MDLKGELCYTCRNWTGCKHLTLLQNFSSSNISALRLSPNSGNVCVSTCSLCGYLSWPDRVQRAAELPAEHTPMSRAWYSCVFSQLLQQNLQSGECKLQVAELVWVDNYSAICVAVLCVPCTLIWARALMRLPLIRKWVVSYWAGRLG